MPRLKDLSLSQIAVAGMFFLREGIVPPPEIAGRRFFREDARPVPSFRLLPGEESGKCARSPYARHSVSSGKKRKRIVLVTFLLCGRYKSRIVFAVRQLYERHRNE